jgi:hypothetical protein
LNRRTKGTAAAAAALAATVAVAALLATAASGSGVTGSTRAAAQATARFHDLGAAKRAGYGLLKDTQGIACIAMDGMPAMGAMGVHFASKTLLGDGRLTVARPEALVYAPTGSGPRLAAVEYVVLKAQWDAKHASVPALFGHRFNLTPAGNRFGLPAFYSLHAWIWKQNPAGEFAMWNPEVSCK